MKLKAWFGKAFLWPLFVLCLIFYELQDQQDDHFPLTATEISPSWVGTGEVEASNFGFSVGTAGDVNGDGYADVVIGADRYKLFTGRVYVFLGGPEGLNADPFFVASGETVNNHFGYSAGTAGDVNGDGYDDILVGSYHYQNFIGRIYVYAGGASAIDPTPLFTAIGETANSYFGRAVGAAGDVNGDGCDDIIVGAPAYDNWRGKIYVYAGSPAGITPIPIFTVEGETPAMSFGHRVGAAGDVNGDGWADVFFGAHGFDDFTGGVFVYYGSPDGLSAESSIFIPGERVGDHFGFSISAAGDVNGDGFDDLVVGAWGHENNTGRLYVFLGSPDGLSIAPALTVIGEAQQNRFGYSVSTAGDVNGDGFDEMIVGSYRSENTIGRAYVYFGSSSGLDASSVVVISGEEFSDSFGRSVGWAGDVNGDGLDDLVVGAIGFENWTGRAYVYFGE